jgi:amino acid adenylation domain-containing protein
MTVDISLNAVSTAPPRKVYRFPASSAQCRLWVLDQLEPGSALYNVPGALRIRGPLDIQALDRTIQEIVRRHESLRTRFTEVQGEPQQVVDVEATIELQVTELSRRIFADEEIATLVAEESNKPFDLRRGPLLRVRLLRLGVEEHVLLLTMHHIISDGWSYGILVREVSLLYAAFVAGRPSPLPELPIQYGDYSVWQREWLSGEVLERQLSYWRKQLMGVEACELPTDQSRPAVRSQRGASLEFTVSTGMTAKLKELSQKQGVTLFMTMLAAWEILLYRYSGQQDLTVGTPIAGRTRIETEGLIGFFVNTLVLRGDLSGRPSFAQLSQRVRNQTLEAYAHQDLPFERLVAELQPERDSSRSPLFEVMFAMQDAPESEIELGEAKLQPWRTETTTSKFDLILSLTDGTGQHVDGGMEGSLQYSTDLFEKATTARMIEHYQTLLEAVVSGSEQSIEDLPLMREGERHQVLYAWNETGAEFPSGKCVHELFEEQAGKTPETTAVVFEKKELNYGELNARANRLAHYLRELGVKPNARVALCVERGFEMIVGLLAVLKAGGAYVPLDPAYPADRLRYMLADSEPVALLTRRSLAGRFVGASPTTVPVLDLMDASVWSDQPESNLDGAATPEDLACVIYTSASTGQLQGVMVTHRNVVRLVRNTNYADFSSAVVGHVSNVASDASTFEIWGALLNGERLAVIARFDNLALQGLARQLKALNVSILFLTTALFNECVRTSPGIFEGMNQILFGGEKCEPEWVRRALQQQAPREIVHVYGPTETTTFASYFSIKTVQEGRSIPIGRPTANTRIYILDSYQQPVPVGVMGELYIGGAGVAQGYLKRPELTAEKFVQNPFVEEAGARMYRTGDMGRWRGDGNIERLGRKSLQVKVHGYRIQLEEIESRLRGYAGMGEVAVALREDPESEQRLVAYYTVSEAADKAGVDERKAKELSDYLSQSLPGYKVPTGYVELHVLPRTESGEVDREELPTPGKEAFVVGGYEAPQGEIETVIAKIWEDVLHVKQVGRHDDFFDLGGSSLLALQVGVRLRQTLGVELVIRDAFDHSRLSSLAAHIISFKTTSL